MHAALGARALRLHAAADPLLFLREAFVEGGLLALLGFKAVRAALEVGVIVAIPVRENTAIQLHNTRRQFFQKRAIMRHEKQAGFLREQKLFEPQNALDIQMIRRLIQQQQIRLTGQRTSQQHATFQTARQRPELRRGCELQFLDEVIDAHVALPVFLVLALGTQPRRDDVGHRANNVRRHFLRESREQRAGLAKHRARVGLNLARDGFHQRGFARAVASDQTQAFARIDLEIYLVQDRRTTKAEINIKETEQRHKCPNVLSPRLACNPRITHS